MIKHTKSHGVHEPLYGAHDWCWWLGDAWEQEDEMEEELCGSGQWSRGVVFGGSAIGAVHTCVGNRAVAQVC